MPSTKPMPRKHPPRMVGRKRVPRGPDAPHDVLLKGLTERDIEALDAVVTELNDAGRATGVSASRTSVLLAFVREGIARAKRGGAQ